VLVLVLVLATVVTLVTLVEAGTVYSVDAYTEQRLFFKGNVMMAESGGRCE